MIAIISVIIPAYNSASRIKFSLESVIAQNYEDIEIILVDDASHDDTADIAREILSTSGRKFTVITHPENLGVSCARNTGLASSHGEYVSFIDGDDVISRNFLSRLHDAITEHNAQISFCGLKFTDGDISVSESDGASCKFTGEELIFSRTISPVCCLYDRNFLTSNNISFFPGCSSGEDVEFQIKALCCAERVAFVNECMYFYVQHDNMGSVRDNNTREKKIMRYEHNTLAQIRTADFLEHNAKTERVRLMNRNILQPQNIIREFNLQAMKGESYHSMPDGKRKILWRAVSLYTFTRKPEIFFKAFMIMHFPKIYYRMRAE